MRTLCLAFTCVSALAPSAAAQDQPAVFRAGTELVQTDVTVLGENGRFVDGLRREDFELRVDGIVKRIAFFERVETGTANERSQLNAAAAARRAEPSPSDRGRVIFFYVDDLHLDLGSLNATHKLIGDFIDEGMSEDDQVAIVSASGEIGFLQQLTDNRTVLRAALQRIKQRPNVTRDFDRPPMTEYQALLIDKYDRDLSAYFIRETMRDNPFLLYPQAENLVHGRARSLLQKAAQLTRQTLAGLESLIRSSTTLPGRKLVFFLSGGFVLDNSDGSTNLRPITSAAARVGIVIYSIDARGLVTNLPDASRSVADVTGRLARSYLGEVTATQDGLNALARDTGGRPILNTNALEAGLTQALEETAVYYLLAWEPDQASQKAGTFHRIDVKLVEKPDLTVRVRRGFFDAEPAPAAARATDKAPPAPTRDADLQNAIAKPYPELAIPVSLSVNYLLSPDRRMMLSTSIRIPTADAPVRLAGVVVNDRGESGAAFNDAITASGDQSDQSAGYTHQILVPPGLYQVRVVARDEASGRLGSAHAWIEIPNLASGQLALSSLVVGARAAATTTRATGDTQSDLANIRVDRRFPRDSNIRFYVFAYKPAKAAADLAIQVQLLRDNRTIIKTPLKKMTTEDEAADRVPYLADLSLADLPPGPYLLRATVVDRVSGANASQESRFDIAPR